MNSHLQKPGSQVFPFLILTFALGFALTKLEPVCTFRQAMTASFDSTSGRLIKCHLAEDHQSATVKYFYEVDGREWLGDCFSKLSADVWVEFSETLKDSTVGDAVTVYYEANSPSDSVLIRGLSHSGWFQVVWTSGVALGWLAFVLHWVQAGRSHEDCLQEVEDQAVSDGHLVRIRMTPLNLSPLAVGVQCGFLVAVFVAGGVWAGTMLELWQLPLWAAVGSGVVLGVAAGRFDYLHTLHGNERGRWDLIVDHDNRTLQVPALGAWGEPMTVETAAVSAITVDSLISYDSDEPESDRRYTLVLHFREHKSFCTHRFYYPPTRIEGEALAAWIHEAIGLARIDEDSERELLWKAYEANLSLQTSSQG